jgi:V8-like Glu-specific endopeptidase
MKPTITVLAAIALALALPGCASSASSDDSDDSPDIIGGQPESGLPAVGAITYDGSWGCTGTLIGPYRVLTAAHCVLTDKNVPYAPSRLTFVTGPDATNPNATYEVASVRADPAYDGVDASHDVGLMILADAPPLTPIGTLAEMDDSWIGTQLFAVGYGTRHTAHPEAGGGQKYAVWMPIRAMTQFTFRFGNATTNTCYGDSGGPALYRDAAGDFKIAGVVSLGDDDCSQYTAEPRIDANYQFVWGD